MAKIGILCQISQNVLDLPSLWGVLVGMIFQIFVWWSPKGRCYGDWQPVKYGDVRKRRIERIYSLLWHSTMDWPIVNALSKVSMAIIRLYRIQIWWTPSSILGVYAVKTRNFCRDSPAIWRRSSFVTLAFPNGLEDRNFDFSRVISNHFCTRRRNLVRFGSVTPEFKT